jgi:hypothetical protein
MFTFDDDMFLAGYRTRFGPLNQNLVDALRFLIGEIERDTRFADTETDQRQLAYCLATFKWETAHTMRPIVACAVRTLRRLTVQTSQDTGSCAPVSVHCQLFLYYKGLRRLKS